MGLNLGGDDRNGRTPDKPVRQKSGSQVQGTTTNVVDSHCQGNQGMSLVASAGIHSGPASEQVRFVVQQYQVDVHFSEVMEKEDVKQSAEVQGLTSSSRPYGPR